jgi:hypothetical protein
MAQEPNDLLDLLKFELKFLADGGYGRSPHTPWRRQLVFEDSLTCPNFGDPARPHPCSECLLMRFVPSELKDQASPCRLIPLTEKGETIDYFYRCGTQLELEEALSAWLHKQISAIEAQQEAGRSTSLSEAMDPIRLQRWLTFAKDLRVLANLHRDYQDFGVAHALLGHAHAAAENVAGCCEAGRALVQQIEREQQEVYGLLNGATLDVEEASLDKPEVLGQ